MKKSEKEKHEEYVCMYASRMLCNHNGFENIEMRSIFMTLPVTDMRKPDQFKKITYEKMNQTLTKFDGNVKRSDYSMIIAGDVECSKRGKIPDDVLFDPDCPHYHAIFVFSQELWDKIKNRLCDIKLEFAKRLCKLREVTFDVDSMGRERLLRKYGFYFEQVKPMDWKGKKYKFPFGQMVSYTVKTDLLANGRNVMTYLPAVYPYDLYADDNDKEIADKYFVKMRKIVINSK